ncbi:MAG TPA: hypothetical protein VME17_14575 [Bryobacteraceae bacterium]|nr:hypothetical protein [Bryobacteraceae bacterium]
MNPLYRLYFLDHKKRWRAYRWLICLTFLYAVLMNVVLRRPATRVASEASLGAAIGSVLWSLYYWRWSIRQTGLKGRGPQTRTPDSVDTPDEKRLPTLLIGIAACLAILVFSPIALATAGQILPFSGTWKMVEVLATLHSLTNNLPFATLGRPVEIDIVRGNADVNLRANGESLRLHCLHCISPAGLPKFTATAIGQGNGGGAAFADELSEEPVLASPPQPASYFIEGPDKASTRFTVVLDDWHFKNIVFRNAEIAYNGSPTILENVTFVNCRFTIRRTDRGKALARELLSFSTINFNAR